MWIVFSLITAVVLLFIMSLLPEPPSRKELVKSKETVAEAKAQ